MNDRAEEEGDLDALMDRLADGDRSAFDPLFRSLRPRALRVCRAKLGDAYGEDAAQAALCRVFARASEFERGRPLLPWFYAIVANEIRSIHRVETLRGAREDDPDRAANVADPEDPEALLADREMNRALVLAIASLDEEQSTAIASLIDGAPRPAIAPAAFRKRVSRAYARLRLLLGGFNGG